MLQIIFTCHDEKIEIIGHIHIQELKNKLNKSFDEIDKSILKEYAEILKLERNPILSPYISYTIKDSDNIPNDRYFRMAWKDNTDKIEVDMKKACHVHMNNLRKLRQKQFEKLGFPTKINSELENLLSSELKDTLKSLRDIPQTYDLSVANTPDELKSMIPESLK